MRPPDNVLNLLPNWVKYGNHKSLRTFFAQYHSAKLVERLNKSISIQHLLYNCVNEACNYSGVVVSQIHLECLKILLDNGIILNSGRSNISWIRHGFIVPNECALMLAAERSCLEILQSFLNYSISQENINIAFFSACKFNLGYTYNLGSNTSYSSEVRVKCLQFLLEKGAQINFAPLRGQTVLMFASMRNDKEIVLLLLEHGADINIVDNYFGKTAAQSAYSKEICEIIELANSVYVLK